jgi:hypothetical protein
MKDSQSQLATDYEGKIVTEKEEIISVKQIKDLF